MGGCLSRSSIPSSGGHTLGASPTPIDNRGRSQQSQKLPQQQEQQPQQRGPRRQQHPSQTADERRSEAAAAAERRMKAVRLSPASLPPVLS